MATNQTRKKKQSAAAARKAKRKQKRIALFIKFSCMENKA